MTHEQFIELETARLARKAGFDWKVCAYYGDNVFFTSSYYGNFNKRDLADYTTFSAPTQSVLQRWLREVKGMSVEVYHAIVWGNDGSLGIKWAYNVCYLNSNERDVLPFDEFDTYEAALEAGLQECLTLIIEKKTMTREQEIEQAIRENCLSSVSVIFFKMGAEWADAHQPSPWVRVVDRLPEEDPDDKGYSVEVIGLFSDGCVSKCYCSIEEGIWFIKGLTCDRPTHWMPIPELQTTK